MRPLDPADGVAERFACELRALRAVAGDLPFWKMARRCDVSKSALAAAVAGYELPSERVTRAFVQACHGDWSWWSARLALARTQLDAAADTHPIGGSPQSTSSAALVPRRRMLPVRVVHGDLAVRAGSPPTLPVRLSGNSGSGSRRRARWRRIYVHHSVIVPVSAALVVLAAVAMAVPPSGAPRTAPPSSPQSAPPPPATATTALSPSSAPRTPPSSLPPPSPPSTTSGLPAAIDLVRMVYGGDVGDTHVTAQPLYLTAGQLGQLNATEYNDSAHQAWFTAHGGVDLGTTEAQITVEGRRDHPVRILDLQPVATCSAPLTGTLFLSPPAGAERTTQLYLDLDSPNRTLRYTTWNQQGLAATGKDYFGDYTVSLAPGEQWTFELVASSTKHYCTFTLDMTVADGGQTIVEHISNDGQPFAVSALAPRRTAATSGTAGVYSAYNVLYLGGVLTETNNRYVGWVRKDPNTYAP